MRRTKTWILPEMGRRPSAVTTGLTAYAEATRTAALAQAENDCPQIRYTDTRCEAREQIWRTTRVTVGPSTRRIYAASVPVTAGFQSVCALSPTSGAPRLRF